MAMKKIVILAISLIVTSTCMWGQIATSLDPSSKLKNLYRLVNQWETHYENNTYWLHDNQGLPTHRKPVEFYLGHLSDTLKAISDNIDAYLKSSPNHVMDRDIYFTIKKQLGEYLLHHPKEAMEANCLLGDMIRYASSKEDRNYDRASEYYYMSLLEVPVANKRLRGALNVRMGLSRPLEKTIYQDFTYTIHNLFYAAKEDPYYATMLGECFMLGLGVYQDMGLALALLDLGAMSGNTDSYLYLNMIQYITEHPAHTAQEELAEEKLFSYMIKARVMNKYDDALEDLISAVEDGNVLAYYKLGQLYNDILNDNFSESDQEYIKDEIFSNLKKAADAKFLPAMFDLALFCMENNYEIEKGNIYQKDKKGNYRDKDLKIVNEKALKMLELTAEMHYGRSYDYLGDLYGMGGKNGIPARNYEKSAYYHLIASQRGTSASLTKLKGYMGTGLIGKERMEELVKETEEVIMMHEMSRATLGRMIFDNAHNAKFKRTPFSFYQETFYLPETIEQPDPLLTDILAKCYHMTYEKYVVQLMDEIIQKGENQHMSTDGRIMYLQIRMKDIRESFNRKGIGLPIAKSVYENIE